MNRVAALHTFRRLLPALRPEWPGMLRSYLIGTASALTLAALTVLCAWAVGRAVVERELPGTAWWLVLGGLVLVRTVLTWREMDVSHALAYRVLARLRMALFDAYAHSVPGRTREHSGRAAAVAMEDIEKLEFFYAHTIAQVGACATVFLASTVTAFTVLPWAGLVVLVGGVVITSSAFYWAQVTRDLGAVEHAQRSGISTGIVDALGALREVLAYGLVPRVVAETARATARTTAVARRRELVAQLVTAVRELAVTAVVITVIAVSATTVLGEQDTARFDAAALPALIALSMVGVSAVSDATTTITQLHPLVTSAQRVADGIDRAPVVRATVSPRSLPDGPLGLGFETVTFDYGDRHPALREFTAYVAPGEHVGLAGPSGAGKSTIIALASRLWDPDGGRVLLRGSDGVPVAVDRVADAELRRAVAVVNQESTLFHGTVRENLLRGTHDRCDERLREVLALVGAVDWLGLDDPLGQNGVRLSGGQQARLCLARALVREPRILLVDEVTASLDPVTEREISGVIERFPGTVLMASHRRESLARMQRIIVLENGPSATDQGSSP